jgi:hypothetical protein
VEEAEQRRGRGGGRPAPPPDLGRSRTAPWGHRTAVRVDLVLATGATWASGARDRPTLLGLCRLPGRRAAAAGRGGDGGPRGGSRRRRRFATADRRGGGPRRRVDEEGEEDRGGREQGAPASRGGAWGRVRRSGGGWAEW